MAWRAVADDALAPAASTLQIGTALAGGGGSPWLLGGDTRATATVSNPRVGIWASPAAVAWTRLAPHGLTLDAPQSYVFSMAKRDGVYVALGETPGMAHGNPRPTIWRSTDGSTWNEVFTLREDFGGPNLTDLRAVASGPNGFLVAGNYLGDHGQPIIAVWLSGDGVHWTRLDRIPELSSQGSRELTVDAAAGGPGGWAVVGHEYAPTDAHPDHVAGFVATSPDGRRWTRVPAGLSGMDLIGQTAVHAVTAAGDGFVALGVHTDAGHTDIIAWRTARAAFTGPGGAPGPWQPTRLATTDQPYGTALAVDGPTVWAAVGTDAGLHLWRSAGGSVWQRVNVPVVTGSRGVHLAAGSHLLLLAAQAGDRARVWLAATR